MDTPSNPHFDPTWDDDVYDPRPLEIPLALPKETAPSGNVWISKTVVPEETIFGRKHVYDPPLVSTAVTKPSFMTQYYQLVDKKGRVIPPDSPLLSLIFPPKAWMSDRGQERCSMFAAAKRAQGRVLVGGLGLAIYPQFVLALERPVESITIVEPNTDIIGFMKQAWLQTHPEHARMTTIVQGTIEDYLSDTDGSFDTIYLDTWEDGDPRFLPHVNYLIQLASARCTPEGTIQCWSYADMVHTFVEDMKIKSRQSIPWDEYRLDPLLQAFVDWLQAQDREDLTDERIERVARKLAVSVRAPLGSYERHRCFSTFGASRWAIAHNLALARKDEQGPSPG